MQCEQCSVEHDIEWSYSMLIVLQKATLDGSSYYQCDGGLEHNGLTFQHWTCNPQCLKTNVLDCINNDFAEEKLVNDANVRFHRVVLKSGLICPECGQNLTSQAVRFVLEQATPANYHVNGDWCCSFEHAKKHAIDTINERY